MKVIIKGKDMKVKVKKKKMDKAKPDKPPKGQAVSLGIIWGRVEEQNQLEGRMTSTQQVTLTLNPLDKNGNPAKVDGVPEWQIDNPALATVTPAADGLTALVKALGAPGKVNVKGIVDADLTSGVRNLEATLAIDITSAVLEAQTLTITAGDPVEQTR